MSKDEVNAYMGARTAYQGKLTFQGAVHVDGMFSGEISSDGVLRAGKDSVIEGSLDVGELELSGSFTGEVRAKRRVLVHRGGVLNGTIISPVLVVEEGAVLEGRSTCVSPSEATCPCREGPKPCPKGSDGGYEIRSFAHKPLHGAPPARLPRKREKSA